jgi:hypothetical protein
MSAFDHGTDYDPLILLPNRLILDVVTALCPCGGSMTVRDGILGAHFPPIYNGVKLRDPFLPGTGLCRYSGRTVAIEAAQQRDNALTEDESRIRGRLKSSPSAWLGLLTWVTFEDVKAGDLIGFTQLVQDDPYELRYVVERQGTVTRRGKTFAVVACGEDEVRLTLKTWKTARPRIVG